MELFGITALVGTWATFVCHEGFAVYLTGKKKNISAANYGGLGKHHQLQKVLGCGMTFRRRWVGWGTVLGILWVSKEWFDL